MSRLIWTKPTIKFLTEELLIQLLSQIKIVQAALEYLWNISFLCAFPSSLRIDLDRFVLSAALNDSLC